MRWTTCSPPLEIGIDAMIGAISSTFKRRPCLNLDPRVSSKKRQGATDHNMLSVSLLGYTNAGEIPLFNALNVHGTYGQNQLFVSGPRLRRIWIRDVAQVTFQLCFGCY